MKQYLLLVTFGLFVGSCLVGGLLFVAGAVGLGPLAALGGEATHFSSIDDFHRKMVSRDDRDQKQGANVSLRSIITPHPKQEVMYDLLPNQSVRFQGVPVRLNSCGMRGAEKRVEKTEDVIRVAFLGDSFTFGWGVEEAESFVEVTGSVLNRALEGTGRTVEVLNFGTPGYSTFQEVGRFVDEQYEFQPDIVVVFFIDNDFGLPFFIGGLGEKGEMVTSTSFARLGGDNATEEVEEKKNKVIDLLDPNKALRELVKHSRKNGYRAFLAFNPHPKWKESLKRLWYVKKSSKLPVINLRPRFLEAMEAFDLKEGELSLPDDPHPSPVKHALLGALLAESLLPEVTSVASVSHDGITG